MKRIALIAACCLLAGGASYARGGGHSGGHAGAHASSSGGSHAVRGYVRRNGTYVAPTRATNPNKTQRDNYSTEGNVNPANGKQGTKTADR